MLVCREEAVCAWYDSPLTIHWRLLVRTGSSQRFSSLMIVNETAEDHPYWTRMITLTLINMFVEISIGRRRYETHRTRP